MCIRDRSTWYAAGVGGGVWKTSNSGTSWTSLSQDLENIAYELSLKGQDEMQIFELDFAP